MKKCNKECDPLCDFCIFYTKKRDQYGDGICRITKKRHGIIDHCKRFHCFRIKEVEAIKEVLKLPEIQTHLRRKKAAWKKSTLSEEVTYRWVQHWLAEKLHSELMKIPVSTLLRWYQGGFDGLKKK